MRGNIAPFVINGGGGCDKSIAGEKLSVPEHNNRARRDTPKEKLRLSSRLAEEFASKGKGGRSKLRRRVARSTSKLNVHRARLSVVCKQRH